MHTPPLKMPHAPGWVGEFRAFVLRGNVMDLAVGIVIGAAFTAIVNSLVKDLLTPVLGLILGGIDFSNHLRHVAGRRMLATLEAAKAAGAVTLNVGLFLNACISFLIVSFAIFWMIKVVNRFLASPAAAAEPAKLTPTEQTLIEIRDLLARERALVPAPSPSDGA